MPASQPSRKIFICTNGKCIDPDLADALLQRVDALIREYGLDRFDAPFRVKAASCGCLDVCENGPVMRVLPDRITYFRLSEADVERVFCEHILAGVVVADLVFEGKT